MVVGSDLAGVALSMAKVNAQTDDIRRQLKQLEKRFQDPAGRAGRRHAQEGRSAGRDQTGRGRGQAAVRRHVKAKNKDLSRCDRQAAEQFQNSTRQVFARLYHESFHAYLENCVYPHNRYDVPRWLNEGLAVTFEGGILEADALRVDAPNAVALKRLKADFSSPQPLSLERLLSTSAAAFLERHDTRQAGRRSALRLCLGAGLLPGLRAAPVG